MWYHAQRYLSSNMVVTCFQKMEITMALIWRKSYKYIDVISGMNWLKLKKLKKLVWISIRANIFFIFIIRIELNQIQYFLQILGWLCTSDISPVRSRNKHIKKYKHTNFINLGSKTIYFQQKIVHLHENSFCFFGNSMGILLLKQKFRMLFREWFSPRENNRCWWNFSATNSSFFIK